MVQDSIDNDRDAFAAVIDRSISEFPAAWQQAWTGISSAFRSEDATSLYANSQLKFS
jgi:hypothetical protein